MQARMVHIVTNYNMDGDTPLEKKLNAMLTREYIVTRDIPADECLSEAKRMIEFARNSEDPADVFREVWMCLYESFGRGYKFDKEFNKTGETVEIIPMEDFLDKANEICAMLGK